MSHPALPRGAAAVAALFHLGWRTALGARALLAAVTLTNLMLIAVFASIFRITPFDELAGLPEIEFTTMVW